MKRIISKGQTQVFKVLNENISGLIFNLNNPKSGVYYAKDANIVITYVDEETSENKVIYDDNLARLIKYERAGSSYFVNQLTGPFSQSKQFRFSLMNVLNLSNTRYLQVEIENNIISDTGAENPVADTDIIFTTVQAIGVQKFVPMIRRIMLSNSLSEELISLGSNVKKVVLQEENEIKIIDEVEFTSDKFNAKVLAPQVYDQLLNGDELNHEYSTNAPSINVYNGEHLLNDLSLNFKWTESGSGKELFVCSTYTSSQMLSNLITKTEVHNEQNVKTLTQTLGGHKAIKPLKADCGCN